MGDITNGVNQGQENVKPLTKPVQQTNFVKDLVKGGLVGFASSTVMFPIDKISFVLMTLKGEKQLTLLDATKRAFRWPNTFNGYLPGMASTLAKYAVVFSSKGEIEKCVDGPYVSFVSGLLGVYLTSPFAVVKALAYNNQPIKESISKLNYADYFRGVHTKALCDGVYFGFYLNALPAVKNALNNSPVAENPVLNNNPVAGGIAGFAGGFFSNPLAMITMGQKVNGTSLAEEAKSLYQDGGVSRFYRGFFKTNALRMGAQGLVVATAMEMVDKMHTNNSLKPGSSTVNE